MPLVPWFTLTALVSPQWVASRVGGPERPQTWPVGSLSEMREERIPVRSSIQWNSPPRPVVWGRTSDLAQENWVVSQSPW